VYRQFIYVEKTDQIATIHSAVVRSTIIFISGDYIYISTKISDNKTMT